MEKMALLSEVNDVRIRLGNWDNYGDSLVGVALRNQGAAQLIVTNTIYTTEDATFTLFGIAREVSLEGK